jgi:predicted dehydrogenase
MASNNPHPCLDLQTMPPAPKARYRIGAIGSGFIMRDVQIVSYNDAGFETLAIASRTPANAREAAQLRGIPRVYDTWQELIADTDIEVLDIAFPPDQQLEIVQAACEYSGHIKGILAQKPLAMNYPEARAVVRACDDAGIVLGVNQNMRYDQSIRALKTILDRGYLGEPVLGTIEMRAIPHWQPFLEEYDRLTLLNMSIHHLDCFRFLFGDPASVYASCRPDPRTQFAHRDGICLYILEYEDGLRACSWDDVWAGPAREGAAGDCYIKWRVEGTEGLAQGTIGWPGYPNRQPSTIEFSTTKQPGGWFRPQWREVWFPDAFSGTMGMLFDAIATGTEPTISGRDNLNTMALVDACYRSIDEHRPVAISEVTGKDG